MFVFTCHTCGDKLSTDLSSSQGKPMKDHTADSSAWIIYMSGQGEGII